jgi:hypothetical protein
MYDFESVSVSSYEAASLAATLTEKSADGWDVVAIVNAGSDVVAYLRRANESTASAEADASIAASTDAAAAESTDESAAAEMLTATSIGSEPSEPAADTSASTAAADSGGTGWGAGADTTAAAATGAGWGDSSESSSWSGSAQQTTTAAATPSVPAGWYADPAGRFELRYWDGTAWTEHVSRGGQQYTDPPVA